MKMINCLALAALLCCAVPTVAHAQTATPRVCKATAAAPTNAEGTFVPLSCELDGDMRINSAAGTGASAQQVQGTAATDAAVVGNPLYIGGRASTATPAAVSGDGDAVPFWLLRTGAQVVAGPVASDSALGAITTFNPLVVGGRASLSTPSAVSTNGDAVPAWFTRDGTQVIGGRTSDFPITPLGAGEAASVWLNPVGAVMVQSAPPVASRILAGYQSFTSTTAATTVITIPADATWEGTITVSCVTAIAAASTTAGQATGLVTVAGAGATPTAGTYLNCDGRAGANAAAGTVGSSGQNVVSIPFIVTAGSGAAATIQCASTNAGTFSRVTCAASGRITGQVT